MRTRIMGSNGESSDRDRTRILSTQTGIKNRLGDFGQAGLENEVLMTPAPNLEKVGVTKTCSALMTANVCARSATLSLLRARRYPMPCVLQWG
jgi:hypothetical protein